MERFETVIFLLKRVLHFFWCVRVRHFATLPFESEPNFHPNLVRMTFKSNFERVSGVFSDI